MADPKSNDFNLRKPAAPQPPPPAAAQPAATQQPLPAADGTGGLAPNDMVIGLAAVLALAVMFLFVRGGLRSHLIAQRASPSAAGNAGWSLWAFLTVLSATVVFGFLGDLWQVLTFLIPMGVLVVVTLVVFGMLYSSAARGRR